MKSLTLFWLCARLVVGTTDNPTTGKPKDSNNKHFLMFNFQNAAKMFVVDGKN